MLMWQWIVITFALLVGVAALMAANRTARRAEESQQRLLKKIDELENDLSAIMDGAFGVANRLQDVESDLKETVERQEHIQQQDLGNLPYNQAVRLASQGAGVVELVEQCGLSRSEAELIALLHKKAPPVISPKRMPQTPGIEQPDRKLETPPNAGGPVE